MSSNIGRLIYGYCEGYFGRDHYSTCRIEAEGFDWIVVRPIGGSDPTPDLAAFFTEQEKIDKVAAWSSEEARRRWTEDG